MAVFLIVSLLSLVGFFIHLLKSKEQINSKRIVELFLLYQLIFNVGVISFIAFIGLTFLPNMVAKLIGWPACPFEQELANVNLAFGTLGILCIWLRDNFWTATIIGVSIWLLGDAIGHIVDIVVAHNYAPGNAGAPLYTDILVPIMLLSLLYMNNRLEKKFQPLLKKSDHGDHGNKTNLFT